MTPLYAVGLDSMLSPMGTAQAALRVGMFTAAAGGGSGVWEGDGGAVVGAAVGVCVTDAVVSGFASADGDAKIWWMPSHRPPAATTSADADATTLRAESKTPATLRRPRASF